MIPSDKFLESKGIRPTAMRLLVFQHLVKSKVATTLSDIENAFAKADRTTLFRTLKTFEQKRLSGVQRLVCCGSVGFYQGAEKILAFCWMNRGKEITICGNVRDFVVFSARFF